MAVTHTVQYVPQVTYCGTQPSSICKWLSDAKYENLYMNHMHLTVSHINLLFPPLQQVLNSAHNHSEPSPILVLVVQPLRWQTAQNKNESQPQGVGSFSSRRMKVVTNVMPIIFFRIYNNYNEIYIDHGYILYKAFHKVSSFINTLFPTLNETLYASCHIKLTAEASKPFMHAMFQLIISRTASSDCILQAAKQMEAGEC